MFSKALKKAVVLNDSIFNELRNPLSFITNERHYRHKQVIHTALMNARGILRNIEGKKKNFFIQQKLINLHKSSFHDKFTLGFGVFFLFLVGAALGAIIRKGGLGLPVVLAILIFLSYHYIGLFGKNAAEDSSISPFIGSWTSVLIIGLFALYLTKRASRDRGIVDLDRIIYSFEKNKRAIKEFNK